MEYLYQKQRLDKDEIHENLKNDAMLLYCGRKHKIETIRFIPHTLKSAFKDFIDKIDYPFAYFRKVSKELKSYLRGKLGKVKLCVPILDNITRWFYRAI